MWYIGTAVSTVLIFIGQTAPQLSWLERGGIVGLALTAVLSFIRGWVHTDREFQSLKQDKDFYRTMALDNLKLAKQATDTARQIAPQSIEEMATLVDEARKKGLL